MKKVRASRRTTRSGGSTSRYDPDSASNMFDHCFGVIDGAVTGAIMAGMHPLSFEPVLAFWFLNVAARTRLKSNQVTESWITGKQDVFDLVLKAVADFARSYNGELDDRGEEQELNQLAAGVRTDRPVPVALELRRQNEQATEIITWVLDVLSRNSDLPGALVELAFLVEWLKVASLSADVDEKIYLVVKQSVPMVCAAYEPVLDD